MFYQQQFGWKHKKIPTPGVKPGPAGWKPAILAIRPVFFNLFEVAEPKMTSKKSAEPNFFNLTKST